MSKYGMIYLFKKTKVTNLAPCDEKGRSPLHYAAEFGQLSVVKFIINAVENRNPGDFGGVTPLHLAVKNSHMLVVLLILDQVQDKNVNCVHIVITTSLQRIERGRARLTTH